MNSIEVTFENPWILLLLIPAVAVILLPFILLPKGRRKTLKKILPLVLHLIIVVLLVLILSGFTILERTEEQAVMILADLSDSTLDIQEELKLHTDELLKLIDKHTPVGIVAFGKDQLYSLKLSQGNRLAELDKPLSDATDISAALEYAASLAPQDRSLRIILLSDGKQTDGNAEKTAYELATKGVRLDAVYYDTTKLSSAEIQISSLSAPQGIYLGKETAIIAEIRCNSEIRATLTLSEDGIVIWKKNDVFSSGSTILNIPVTPQNPGTPLYSLTIEPEKDGITKNNHAAVYLPVAERSSVLIISDTMDGMTTLASVIAEKHDVQTVLSHNAPKSLTGLCEYDMVILSNVDFYRLPGGYDHLLEDYVGTYGRSLLAVGGDQTFMYGNMQDTDIEEIMPVSFEFTQNEGRSVALMLVLDCSSSMSSEYLSLAKQGALNSVAGLTDNDFAGVISFSKIATLEAPLVKVTDENRESLNRVISGLTNGRGTYYTEAIELAHSELSKSDAQIKHIIFLSDGQPSDSGYYNAVLDAANDGITVSTIGLSFSSDKLLYMSEYGNGRYYYVASAEDLPNIMISETEEARVSPLLLGNFTPVVKEQGGFTDGLEEKTLPTINGYLGTTLKEGATLYLESEEGHPIYAATSYGFGKTACFTTDLNGNWASAWLKSTLGKELILKMVSKGVSDVHCDSSLKLETPFHGNSIDLKVYATETNSETTLQVKMKDTQGAELEKELTLTRPGIYEGSLLLPDSEGFELMISQKDSYGMIVDELHCSFAVPYSEEYNAFAQEGESFLRTLCAFSSGTVFESLSEAASVEIFSISIVHDPLLALTCISVFLLLADIAIRKLRWKDIKNLFIGFTGVKKL